ncbi:MAG TPA: hypothetical protein VFP68_08645 [Burkholderiaceae bacterium]|nr:hypothetical protein [Burkholderiaceae bacterium]
MPQRVDDLGRYRDEAAASLRTGKEELAQPALDLMHLHIVEMRVVLGQIPSQEAGQWVLEHYLARRYAPPMCMRGSEAQEYEAEDQRQPDVSARDRVDPDSRQVANHKAAERREGEGVHQGDPVLIVVVFLFLIYRQCGTRV